MQRTKTNFTEEAFLLSTFYEFIKCWKSSKRPRLFIDSVNGNAFVNFSAFLGDPSEAHFQPNSRRRKPPPEESKRKKSSKKIQRDNDRAAKFQEKKRQEQAAASAASGDPPPATSSPAESSVEEASVHFSFASPAAEDLTNNAMEGISSPQLSPEDLRQQMEDSPSLTLSQKEEDVRENQSEPFSENITIPEEEVLQSECNEPAFEETESPGLDFEFVHDVEALRRKYLKLPLYSGPFSSNSKSSWARQSKWFMMNHETAPRNDFFGGNAKSIFLRRILRCKKPKLFVGSSLEEPCNSPAYECCLCSPRTPKKPWA